MTDQRRTTVSKYISKHLRHAPEAIGLRLAEGGWAGIDELISAAGNRAFHFTRDELDEVVRLCAKQRFAVDGDRIRANQGHSVEVDLALAAVPPPALLYHGTATRFREPILSAGLLRMSRQHVHLSAELETAVSVGRRHGRPLVFAVDTMTMSRDGFAFFRAANGVWLTDHVPPRYLRELEC